MVPLVHLDLLDLLDNQDHWVLPDLLDLEVKLEELEVLVHLDLLDLLDPLDLLDHEEYLVCPESLDH